MNKDGSLDYHEFMRFVRSLDLNLSTREAFSFFAEADRDNDERIVWSEVRVHALDSWVWEIDRINV